MKLIITIFFILGVFQFIPVAQGQNISAEHETYIYEVANSLIDSFSIKRVRLRPVRFIYSSKSCEWNDTCNLDLVSSYIDRLTKEASDFNCVIDSVDISFMIGQIKNPKVDKFNRSKIKKAKVRRKQGFIFLSNPISVPLFTVDYKYAVITMSDYGLTRTYLYSRTEATGQWIELGLLWQDGN